MNEGVEFWVNDASRLRVMENALLSLWGSWGYREVVTPAFVEWEALGAGMGDMGPRACKVLDQDGRVLLLRPDVTLPIARLAATDFRDEPRPLRLSYAGAVFQRSQAPFPLDERPQCGLELIGMGGHLADAEVLVLAAESLRVLGLDDFRLMVGHMEVLDALLEKAGLNGRERDEIKALLQKRDHVALGRTVMRWVPGAAEWLLPLLTEPLPTSSLVSGGRVADLRGLFRETAAWDGFLEVLSYMHEYGIQRHVMFEPGLVRGLGYYTGMVFEISTPFLGRPVGGGGRYDGLIGRFGEPEPATGFAFDARCLLETLKGRGLARGGRGLDVLLLVEPGVAKAGWARAREMRQDGLRVEVRVTAGVGDLIKGPPESLAKGVAAYASRCGVGRLVVLQADGSEHEMALGSSGGGLA